MLGHKRGSVETSLAGAQNLTLDPVNQYNFNTATETEAKYGNRAHQQEQRNESFSSPFAVKQTLTRP